MAGIDYSLRMSTPRQQKVRFVLHEAPAIFGDKPLLDRPEEIFDFYKKQIRQDPTFELGTKEHLFVLALDSRLKLIGFNLVSIGTVNECPAHPREIVRPILALNGTSFVLIHNHPAGDPSPSNADRAFTRKMVEVSDLLNIGFIDHCIVTDYSYFSFREAGLI